MTIMTFTGVCRKTSLKPTGTQMQQQSLQLIVKVININREDTHQHGIDDTIFKDFFRPGPEQGARHIYWKATYENLAFQAGMPVTLSPTSASMDALCFRPSRATFPFPFVSWFGRFCALAFARLAGGLSHRFVSGKESFESLSLIGGKLFFARIYFPALPDRQLGDPVLNLATLLASLTRIVFIHIFRILRGGDRSRPHCVCR